MAKNQIRKPSKWQKRESAKMCFKEVDVYDLREKLQKGIPSIELQSMLSMPLSAAWTVEDYINNRIAEGTVVENNGYYKFRTFKHPGVK
jgi:hypothetical protein